MADQSPLKIAVDRAWTVHSATREDAESSVARPRHIPWQNEKGPAEAGPLCRTMCALLLSRALLAGLVVLPALLATLAGLLPLLSRLLIGLPALLLKTALPFAAR